MKDRRLTNASFCLVMMLLGLSGCTSNNQNAQQRQAEDEKTRQEAADTTQKAKEDASYVPLVELMKTLRTGVEENTVVWRAQLTRALTEKLLGNLGK